MKLPEICIQRPVLTIAMMLVLIIIGAVAFERLTVRELPAFDQPMVTVITTYSGADASLVENEITTLIENVLSGISGVKSIVSRSRQGKSLIDVNFELGHDIDVGVSDVRNKLSLVYPRLPKNIDYPLVLKNDTEANPVLILALMDKQRNGRELTDYAERYITPLLEQIDGVNNVDAWGQRTYAMRVWLNSQEMAARQLGVNDVINALNAQNVNVPSGDLRTPLRDYPLSVKARFHNVRQFQNLIIRSQDGAITRLRDIADVEVGAADIDSAFRVNGETALALAIVPTSVANPIAVAKQVEQTLQSIRQQLPTSMDIQVLYNPTQFIEASIDKVYSTWIEALILVILVIFLFLGSWRSTLIPIVTIPVCVVATFALLYVFGYSINTITLLALVLAIGLVVDDAIVILENIHRHIEQGMRPIQAAFKGSREIGFAIVAMTLTLTAVYLPVSFSEGVTGIIFRQFALTLAGAVLISGFVALTLSPMMCAHGLRNHNKEGRYERWLERASQALMQAYKTSLHYMLSHRWIIMLILIFISAIGIWMYKTMPSEVAPQEDRGYLRAVVNAPSNASFNYTDAYAQEVEGLLANTPDVDGYLMVSGTWDNPRRALAIANLIPWDERDRTAAQIRQTLVQQFRQLPGADTFIMMPNKLAGRRGQDRGVEVKITSTVDYPELVKVTEHIAQVLRKYPGLQNIDTDLSLNVQQFNLQINYDLAADLQVSVADISQALATFIGGQDVGRFSYDGRDYGVMLQLPRSEQAEFSMLDQIYVRSAKGDMIPLASLVTIKPEVSAFSLPHYNRLRVDSITADLTPGYSLGEVVSYLAANLPKLLPNHAQYAFGDAIERLLSEQGHMMLIYLLASLFIYLVLAAQFESFIDPLIVLLSVPLSLIGGLLTLKLAGGTLNIYSQIAMVTLIGLIAKHGILITEFANQKREQGLDKMTAVIEAAALRLRPILMTKGAMVFGAIPLALATGPGGINREQIGWVIVGGMTIGTFFSLFVVPAAYTLLSRARKVVEKPDLSATNLDQL